MERRCIFAGCVSTDRHWHGGFPGGYDNPADPEGPPIPFTTVPAPGVRDYNGALLPDPDVAEARERARHDWDEDNRERIGRILAGLDEEPNPEGDPSRNGAFG